jgi:hypothetical protein
LKQGLAKVSNEHVKTLGENVIVNRIQQDVELTRTMVTDKDREKLAKLKQNGNEKMSDDRDDLDSYDKYILEFVIQHEKLMSVQKEQEWTTTSVAHLLRVVVSVSPRTG